MWCGEWFDPCFSGDPSEGYGNNYREALDWSYTVADPFVPTSVTITFDLNIDTEAADILYVQYETTEGMVNLQTYSGTTYDAGASSWEP